MTSAMMSILATEYPTGGACDARAPVSPGTGEHDGGVAAIELGELEILTGVVFQQDVHERPAANQWTSGILEAQSEGRRRDDKISRIGGGRACSDNVSSGHI